jgi:hypothetical protein
MEEAEHNGIPIKWGGKRSQQMTDGYVKYVQECNEKVKATGNTAFKASPEFVWQQKIYPKNSATTQLSFFE